MDVLLESQHFAIAPKLAPTVAGMTYSSMQPDRVIDWILIPKTWSFSNYRVLLSDLSDHRPVVADLLIAP
jgi:endonuclease/exonuclease/phosphatase family metal-dependent hydrolase